MSTRIGFSTAKRWNPLSAIIRWATGVPYSHCFMLYTSMDFPGSDMVMEAHTTFRITTLKDFERNNRIIKVIQPRGDMDPGRQELVSLLGTNYDTLGLLGMAEVVFGKRFWKRLRNPFRSSRTVFCSEAVARAALLSPDYAQAGFSPEDVTPQDLDIFFSSDALSAPGEGSAAIKDPAP